MNRYLLAPAPQIEKSQPQSMRMTRFSGQSYSYTLLTSSQDGLDDSPVSIDSGMDLIHVPLSESTAVSPSSVSPISTNSVDFMDAHSSVSSRPSSVSSEASSLEDVSWIDDLEHAVERGSMSTPDKDYWRLLLEQTVNLWTLRRMEGVAQNCELAMAHKNDIPFFIMMCFQTIDIGICFGDGPALAELLDDWIKVAKNSTQLTDLDRAGLAFLRQIVFRKDMEVELRACLGMTNPKAQKKLSEQERRAILDDARYNIYQRARQTDNALTNVARSI